MTTWAQSGWYQNNLISQLTGVVQTPAGYLNLTGNDANNYISLLSSAPTAYAAPVNYGGSLATTLFAGTNEVTSTTNWPAGGIQLSVANAGGPVTTTLVSSGGTSSAGSVVYSWTNPVSIANTTIATGIYGFVIYSHAITAPNAKPMILAIYTGVGYTTTSGTLSITPSGSGLSQLTVTG